MIDKGRFAAGMAVLSGAFGREVDDAVITAYYRILSPAMDAAAFERAVTVTMARERFWPSPAVLLQHAGLDLETRALAALQEVNRVIATHGGVQFVPRAAWEAFDADTRAAIRVCGGLAEIAGVTTERYAALQRRWAKAWTGASALPAAIPAGDLHPAVQTMVNTLTGPRNPKRRS
jgi:hypothetical protein